MEQILEYGLRDNKIISVHSLAREENGEKCNCTCPACGGKLIAKLGTKKRWHFAHKETECNIIASQQTALHMLAKEIISENKRLLFPGINVKRNEFLEADIAFRVQEKIPYIIEYRKPTIVNCDDVWLEKKLTDIVPDIIVSAKGHVCLVEIAVTHFVDDEKEQKIKERGLPLLEINLSNLHCSGFSRGELIEAVLYNPNNRRWIYNPLYDVAKARAKDEYSQLVASAMKDLELEKIKYEEDQKRRSAGKQKIKNIFDSRNYEQAVLSLKDDVETAKILNTLHMKVDIDTLPFFLNIPITGEMVFRCDRRIWQSILFDKFVYNRNAHKPTVNIKRVQCWLKDHNDCIPIDWALTYKTDVQINSSEYRYVTLFYDVVFDYFNYLVYLGFLNPFNLQEAGIKQTHSLTPPNKTHADILVKALKKVDWYNPSVNSQLSRLIASECSTKFL